MWCQKNQYQLVWDWVWVFIELLILFTPQNKMRAKNKIGRTNFFLPIDTCFKTSTVMNLNASF